MSEEIKSDTVSYLNNFENHPVLSEFGFWKYKNAVQIQTLAGVLEGLSTCEDLEQAKSMVKIMHDSYMVSSWPGGLVRDESTDHQL
jgi:hypothetical protein